MTLHSKGFNLVEVMAAVFVLSVAIFAVLSVNAYTLRLNTAQQQLQTANSIASSQLSVVESVLKSDFHATADAINTPLLQSRDFPDFSFAVVDDGYEDPTLNLRAVRVVVYWNGKGGPRDYELSTTFYNY